MIKKISAAILFLAGLAFAFDWGVYVGPGINLGMTNMDPIHDEIVADAASDDPNFPDYDVSGFSNFRVINHNRKRPFSRFRRPIPFSLSMCRHRGMQAFALSPMDK